MRPLAERVKSGQFLYITDLVASGLKREAQVLEIASKLAMIPEVAAGSITSYAGGQLGQDSIRVGTAVRARGLVPKVTLLFGNRSSGDVIFRERLAALAAKHAGAFGVDHVLEVPDGAMDCTPGRLDASTTAARLDAVGVADGPEVLYFVCGPTPMMDAAITTTQTAWSWPWRSARASALAIKPPSVPPTPTAVRRSPRPVGPAANSSVA